MNALAVLAIGAMAQVFFSARVLVQWILSERAHKVLSPSLFWVLSLAGAYLLCIYGWLRHDFAIVMGQFVSYYVYLWNLKQKGVWDRLPLALRLVLLFTPPIVLLLVVNNASAFVHEFFFNADVPLWLLLFGAFGQLLFTFRFVYQYVQASVGAACGLLGYQSCGLRLHLCLRSFEVRFGAHCGPVVRYRRVRP